MMENRYLGGAHAYEDLLLGDVFPSNFDFRSPLLNKDLYVLWNRSEFIQLLIEWMPYEAFRRWVQFVEDEGPIRGYKFGQPYLFKGYSTLDRVTGRQIEVTGFEEYCTWNQIQREWIFGVGLSRLYPEGALLVFLDDQAGFPERDAQGNEVIRWPPAQNPQGYYTFRAFQPISVGLGTGFSVEEADENGRVTTWRLQLQTSTMKKAKIFLIEADRCIHLLWKRRHNDWGATSRCTGVARIAQLEGQIFEKLTKRAHDLAGGILTITGIASAAEQQAIDSALGTDLTSVDRIYLQEGRSVEYKTPDLKAAGEFSMIFEMFTRKLCRHMRVSQLILDGEHTGAGLGGNNNVELMNSYAEIYQIQEHYRTDLEHVFYKLGKRNTSFIYNEILPETMTPQEQAIGEDREEGEEEGEEEDEQGEEREEEIERTD